MAENERPITRRDFLGRSAVVGIGVASLGALAACSNNQNTGASGGVEGSEISWDYTTDVVVAGSGAGLLAAIEAADAGAGVILLEKGTVLGGCMNINEGWYTAANSDLQRRSGVTDSSEAFWEKTQELNTSQYPQWAPLGDPDMLRLKIENSGAAIDRLEELGMEFTLVREHTVQEVARAHISKPGPSAWVNVLRPVAEGLGVEIMMETPAVELITQPDKTVIGIKAQNASGKEINIKANKGVILATGDTAGNKGFLKKNYSETIASIPPCWPDNTGDGFLMALGIGADSSQKSLIAVPMQLDPITSYAGPNFTAKAAILVDHTAKRFCNEPAGAAPVLLNLKEDKRCYAIFSQDGAEFARRPPTPADYGDYFEEGKSCMIAALPGSCYAYIEDYLEGKAPIEQADTIEELAGKLGLDPATLKETVNTWNGYVANGEDPDFGRTLEGKAAGSGEITGTGGSGVAGKFGSTVQIVTPPFYALTTNSIGLMLSEGPNLIVDKDMAVLDVYGTPIPNLYACGAGLAAGVPILNLQHGEHLCFSIVSARIAAKSVV